MPRVEVKPDVSNANAHSVIRAVCRATRGWPLPTVHWDIPDLPGATRFHVYAGSTKSESTLILNNVNIEDTGIITCYADNAVGRANSSWSIFVFGKHAPYACKWTVWIVLPVFGSIVFHRVLERFVITKLPMQVVHERFSLYRYISALQATVLLL